MRPSFLRRARTALLLASPAVQADTYTYDVFGNLSTLSSDRGTRSFTYDEINRLKTETGFTGTRAHAYDANTNRTSDGAIAAHAPHLYPGLQPHRHRQRGHPHP